MSGRLGATTRHVVVVAHFRPTRRDDLHPMLRLSQHAAARCQRSGQHKPFMANVLQRQLCGNNLVAALLWQYVCGDNYVLALLWWYSCGDTLLVVARLLLARMLL